MIKILIAFLAGVLTVGAPCILPLLPILLGTSIGQQSKMRPLFITLGFIITFSLLGFLFSLFTHVLGISQNQLRVVAVVFLLLFALFMIWPTPFEIFTTKVMGRFVNKSYEAGDKYGSGLWGGFFIGVTLGVIWTPCAGPVLGSILTLIATSKEISKAIILMLAYAIGAGLPMLAVAYGGQWASKNVRKIAPYSRRIQQVFGILIIALAISILFQYDVLIQAKLTQLFPSQKIEEKLAGREFNSGKDKPSAALIATHLNSQGPAPEFIGISKWVNSGPLTMKDLRGKVVLIDFWTYSCINCIRTLPYTTKWYTTYKDKGFVLVGVHTPEFAFEKDPANVERAVKIDHINYPVAMDNNYLTWSAYHNQYWPAHYLINQNGDVVYTHFGEGGYMETENNIRLLLGLEKVRGKEKETVSSQVQSPEMYFGTARQVNLSKEQKASSNPENFSFPKELSMNEFAMEGTWQFEKEFAKLVRGQGKVRLKFHSGKVYLVAKSTGKPVHAFIMVDGKKLNELVISESQLYTLFSSEQYSEHFLEVQFDGPVELFTFTFG